MPPLDGTSSLAPIRAPSLMPRGRPQHPSPSLDGLRLEVMSAKEIGYHGHIFGVDVPYLMVFSGFGEVIPVFDRGWQESLGPSSTSTAGVGSTYTVAPPWTPPAGVSPQSFSQTQPSTTWTVSHGMGRWPAAVAVYDVNGQHRIVPYSNSDLNTIELFFSTPQTGSVVIL